ncbi:MAG: hypothetical protein ACK5T5_03540 [Phenylobacterium sp.]|jgi:hypothetical protein
MPTSSRGVSSTPVMPRVLGGIAILGAILFLAACQPPPWASQRGPDPVFAVTSEGWAAALVGRTAAEAVPGAGICIGNFDGVRPAKDGVGRSAFGWAWDPTAGAPVSRIILVNASGQVVAAGDGGRVRDDVPKARPDVPSQLTGWVVRTGDQAGPFEAYGIVGGGSALCPLGRNPG